MKRKVVLGMPGLGKDNPQPKSSNQSRPHWRPSITACLNTDDLAVDRFVVIHEKQWADIAGHLGSDIEKHSPETKVEFFPLDNWEDPWDFGEVYESLDKFALEYEFNEEEEDYFVHITTGTHTVQISWFALIESGAIPAQILQTAASESDKPFTPSWKIQEVEPELDPGRIKLVNLEEERYDTIQKRFQVERVEKADMLKMGIATRNRAYNDLIDDIGENACESPAPILLTGPTGVGKTVLAERIFQVKKDKQSLDGEFAAVNCATLRGPLAGSALFGHEEGAFTDAKKAREGLLKKADKGVLFLDEIGELGMEEQAMLLKAIEEKKFLPLGGDEEVESDFHLIAGTNRELPKAVQAGQFRADLLARIDLWTCRLPPLRERKEDIEPNIRHALDQATKEFKKPVSMNKEASQAFLKFAESPEATWPGNFRDFNNAFHRMAAYCKKGHRIGREEVKKEIERLRNAWKSPGSEEDRPLCRKVLGERYGDYHLAKLMQLEPILELSRGCGSMADAGRRLYSVEGENQNAPNYSDKFRKYLCRFGLEWDQVKVL